jgi:hypothetical protein
MLLKRENTYKLTSKQKLFYLAVFVCETAPPVFPEYLAVLLPR